MGSVLKGKNFPQPLGSKERVIKIPLIPERHIDGKAVDQAKKLHGLKHHQGERDSAQDDR